MTRPKASCPSAVPKPTIERTSSSQLRWLAAAAHVKRSARGGFPATHPVPARSRFGSEADLVSDSIDGPQALRSRHSDAGPECQQAPAAAGRASEQMQSRRDRDQSSQYRDWRRFTGARLPRRPGGPRVPGSGPRQEMKQQTRSARCRDDRSGHVHPHRLAPFRSPDHRLKRVDQVLQRVANLLPQHLPSGRL